MVLYDAGSAGQRKPAARGKSRAAEGVVRL
jgi:hypothetical protein